MESSIATIGYGNRSWIEFLNLLQKHGIDAIADIRSLPFSKRFPSFNQTELQRHLDESGIRYVFLGDELGARPNDVRLYVNGRASYPLMAASEAFQSGLDRLIRGSERYRIAIMCAERDPIDCHRAILVAPALEERKLTIRHIVGTHVESQRDLEQRLLRRYGFDQPTLLAPSHGDALTAAYGRRGEEIAYVVSG